jgi:hypothetical protein
VTADEMYWNTFGAFAVQDLSVQSVEISDCAPIN